MVAEILKDAIDSLNLGVCFVDRNKKISYWNKGAENLTGFLGFDVIGKKFGLAKEPCPISETLNDGNQRESDAHVKHKNGKRLHVSVKVTPTRDENEEITGATILFHDISSQMVLINKIKELERSASYDFLTNLPNRRMFEKGLNSRLEEMQRSKNPKTFGLIFVDIDNFKMINDSYGHDVGDLVLKMVSKRVSSTLRPYDLVGRWGGEEFVALVPHVSREQLFAISSRMRSMVERMSVFTGDTVLKVTLSIGATIAKQEDNAQSVIKRADELMYSSKKAGKNKVTLEARN